jgi:hypothetical protein
MIDIFIGICFIILGTAIIIIMYDPKKPFYSIKDYGRGRLFAGAIFSILTGIFYILS